MTALTARQLLLDFARYINTPRQWSNERMTEYRARCMSFFDASELNADEIIARLKECDLRSHEPPRNKPGELEQDPRPSARRD